MPSALILEQKQKTVAALADRIKSAAAGVLVDYQGINVVDDTMLRTELRKAGVEYTVIKNTLISKACDIVGFEGLKDVLSKSTAIATCATDPIAAAKILNEYVKKNDKFTIKAGFVDGEILDVNGVKSLAETPSKEVLLARFMGSLRGPLYGFAFGLTAIIEKQGGNPADTATAEATEAIEASPEA